MTEQAKQRSAQVLVALGSNLGDRRDYIRKAIKALDHAEGCRVIAKAADIETKPLGPSADKDFINTAIIIGTVCSPHELLGKLQSIEATLNRTREVHWGNRTIDLDIALWTDEHSGDTTVITPDLQIPHPQLLERAFVLIPATQIAGHWVHPITKQTLTAEALKRGFLKT